MFRHLLGGLGIFLQPQYSLRQPVLIVAVKQFNFLPRRKERACASTGRLPRNYRPPRCHAFHHAPGVAFEQGRQIHLRVALLQALHPEIVQATAQAAEEPTGPTTYDSGRYVVLLREAPAASYAGDDSRYPATRPTEGGAFRADSQASTQYRRHLEREQDRLAREVGT